MKVKLIGIQEGSISDIGKIVARDQIIDVPDSLGESLCAQIGMWEKVEEKGSKKNEN